MDSKCLTNCFQKVLLDDAVPSFVPISSGVPQGTVLDPLLFFIYINGLPDVVICE